MNVVKCNMGCEHPACEICGTSDPDSGLTHDYWPFGVQGPAPAMTMTTCLPCRNKVFERINTVGKIRLLIGLEQRITVPEPARPPRPAIPEEYPAAPRDTVTNSSPLATAETQILPVALS